MQCPECKNDVPVSEAQFGALFTCPQCMGVYFINFDGQPEFGEMAAEPIVPQSIEEAPDFLVDLNVSPFSQAAQEITDYGNQEEAISQLSYDVIVKGLDTKEVRIAFREAIEDSKFAWVTEDIMNQIKNGEAQLKNLNPIQSFVLATRIQFLDLEVEWKQNVAF